MATFAISSPATAQNKAPNPQFSRGKSQQPPAATGAHISGDHTVKAYKYENAIRESVTIDLDMDYNKDGKKDTVTVDIVRPKEAADAGVKIPVIALPSPYYTSAGRGTDSEKKTYDRSGRNTRSPLFHDNYFVEYGYAVATIDVAGSARSVGCGDIGGKAEIQSVTRVIDWLNGRAAGRYIAGGSGTAVANWTTGSVGLTGKSWDGTMSNGAAATGVEGLRTIVPVAGISSWYDYYRFMGMATRNDGVGELAQMVSNDKGGCSGFHGQLSRDMNTLNVNASWSERDYVKDASKVKASVLIAHGQNDNNVNMRHAGEWFKALRANNVSTAVWLSQSEHTDPFDIDRKNWVSYLHKWFDYWLMGLPNDVMNREGTVEHEIGQFATDAVWPVGAETTIPVSPAGLGGIAGLFNFQIDDGSVSQTEAVTNPSEQRSGRYVFLTDALTQDVRVSGVPTVKVRVLTDGSRLPLSARLVDYGSANRYAGNRASGSRECWGGKTSTDSACYAPQTNYGQVTDTGVIARGWINAAYRDGLSAAKPIPKNEWVDVTIPMMMTDNVVKAGHRMALVLSLGDDALGLAADKPVVFDSAGISLTANVDKPDVITPSTVNRSHASVRALGKQAPRAARFDQGPPTLR